MECTINDKDKTSDEHSSSSSHDKNTHTPIHDCPPSPNTIASRADDIFCHDYFINLPVMHLKLVSEKPTEMFTDWCHIAPKKEEVKEKFKQALVPINIKGLYPVRINDALYHKLPFKVRINVQRLRGLNTFLVRGMGPLTSIFHELCNIEATVKSTTSKSVVKLDEDGCVIIDNVKVDFVDIHCFLGKSL